MLKRIKSIRNYGVFRDFTPSSGLPDFKKYNLIYGPNGSGKTTVTRIINDLGIPNEELKKGAEFSFETDDGTFTNKKPYPGKIRVFNTDYVQSNIGEIEGTLNHILIVGEKNKTLVAELEREEAEIRKREDGIAANNLEIKKYTKQRDAIFTDIAKTISESTSGQVIRTYNRNNAKKAYEALEARVTISDDRMSQLRKSIRQEKKDDIEIITLVGEEYASFETSENPLNAIKKLVQKGNEILPLTVQSITIERLISESSIATWVDAGIAIHKKHKSDNCEFCAQPLPADRLRKLEDHFSDADQNLKEDIKTLIADFKKALTELGRIQFPSETDLYHEYRQTYSQSKKDAGKAIHQLREAILNTDDILSQKLENRNQAFDSMLEIDLDKTQHLLAETNKILLHHNKHTQAFEDKASACEKELEQHYLSDIDERVLEFDTLITALETTNRDHENGITDDDEPRSLEQLVLSTQEKRASISNSHHAGEQLTSNLQAFLGRTDLKLVDGEDGYRVLRYGEAAENLSEGERTAIAFLYFLIQLTDQDFDITEGIVVIDDPVSSLDSASIYQAFSYLKNAVKSSKQLFLLTHNYEFLKLLLHWLQHSSTKNLTSCYMTYCSESGGIRNGDLRQLDKLLRHHDSEYQFIFKSLKELDIDGTIISAYHIPNMARKFLETFLFLYDPSNDKIYKKLDKIKFDDNKKTAIFKFSNELSHYTPDYFNPALIDETRKNVGYLLEMVEEVLPEHYKGLEASLPQNTANS